MTEAEARTAIKQRTRVEGGVGADHDTGIILEVLAAPVGKCDVLVAWDSGVRTPAVAADLTTVK